MNAVMAGALVVLAVTLAAHGCSGSWTAQPAMERYVKLGPRGGAAELERDLLRDHPPGGDIGPLFARLARLGFDCGAAVEPDRGGECRFRTGYGGRRLATATVEVTHDGLRLQSLAARMSVTAP